jgi:hypothetical protein
MPGALPGGGDTPWRGLAEGAMDDDHGVPPALRLPETFAKSGDPVDANPYPTEHPKYQVWKDATRQAEDELCRINSEASSSLTPDNADDWAQTLTIAKFDVWATRGVQVVWTDEDVREYDRWLVAYANRWIESVAGLLTSRPPPFPRERVLADLRRRLGARVHHWKTEARRHRDLQEASDAAEATEIRPSRKLVERRRRAVEKYRDDHDLDAVGFARRVGISDTAVRAIIRDDWSRFNRGTQEKLLALIGMTRDDWYQE